MATFKKSDYSKYNFKYPLAVLNDILNDKPIKMANGSNLDYSSIKKDDIQTLINNIDISSVETFNSMFPFYTKHNGTWSKIFKCAYSHIESKAQFERQERKLVDIINNAVTDNGIISVSFGDKPEESGHKRIVIRNVTSANKIEGMNAYGKEPYADIEIHSRQGTYKISCKDANETPSAIGGGLLGLKQIVPNYIKEKLLYAYEKVSQTKDFQDNKWKDIYVKLDRKTVINLFRGDANMGGPVDYVYKGIMDVNYRFSKESKTLYIDGKVYDMYNYSNKFSDTLYIKIRRRTDNGINTNLQDKNGIPYFTLKKDGKSNNRRIVITDKATKSGLIY